MHIDLLSVQYTCKNQLKINNNLLVKIKGASMFRNAYGKELQQEDRRW
jgi:hypothetical protein